MKHPSQWRLLLPSKPLLGGDELRHCPCRHRMQRSAAPPRRWRQQLEAGDVRGSPLSGMMTEGAFAAATRTTVNLMWVAKAMGATMIGEQTRQLPASMSRGKWQLLLFLATNDSHRKGVMVTGQVVAARIAAVVATAAMSRAMCPFVD
ncbi:unnamed protein product, partial [Sphacelaria rigidula]